MTLLHSRVILTKPIQFMHSAMKINTASNSSKTIYIFILHPFSSHCMLQLVSLWFINRHYHVIDTLHANMMRLLFQWKINFSLSSCWACRRLENSRKSFTFALHFSHVPLTCKRAHVLNLHHSLSRMTQKSSPDQKVREYLKPHLVGMIDKQELIVVIATSILFR